MAVYMARHLMVLRFRSLNLIIIVILVASCQINYVALANGRDVRIHNGEKIMKDKHRLRTCIVLTLRT